jgi:hypothetical protein
MDEVARGTSFQEDTVVQHSGKPESKGGHDEKRAGRGGYVAGEKQ